METMMTITVMIVIYYHHKVEGWVSIYKVIMIFIANVITLVVKIILQKVIKHKQC